MTDLNLHGSLRINQLELKVNLGWRDKEQLEPQAIMCDIVIYFAQEPHATHSDELKDTICYDDLVKKIRSKISTKKYRLIEHLTKEIYNVVEEQLPPLAKTQVNVTKKPKIAGLLGGVTYTVFSTKG